MMETFQALLLQKEEQQQQEAERWQRDGCKWEAKETQEQQKVRLLKSKELKKEECKHESEDIKALIQKQ